MIIGWNAQSQRESPQNSPNRASPLAGEEQKLDRFNGSLHRQKAVHEPQQDSYYDQRHDNLYEWHMHIVFSIRLPGLIGIYRENLDQQARIVGVVTYFSLTSASVPARPISAIAFIKLTVDFGARTLPERMFWKERSRP